MPAIIELNQIAKEYPMPAGNVQALKKVSLSFEEGEFTSVVGASGSGKSTLLYLMGLLIAPSAGTYRFLDQTVEDLSDKGRAGLRGREIGFIFQSFHLVPQLTVVKNVLMGVRYRGEKNGKVRSLPDRAREILEQVGLSHRLNHKPGELSNGEMQRVAIARAVLGDPRVILADEPTGNLDEETGDEIFKLLESMHQDGKTIIMVTHDLQLAARTPRKITLRNGEVIA